MGLPPHVAGEVVFALARTCVRPCARWLSPASSFSLSLFACAPASRRYLYGSVLSCVAVSLLRDLHTAALPAPPTPSPKAKRGMLGTLSLLLIFLFLIPTCTLPLVRFEYSGVAAALIDDADETAEGKLMRELKIYDIGRNLCATPPPEFALPPANMLTPSRRYNDTPEKFIAYNNTFFFYLTCFVCPLIALLAAAAHRQTPSPTLLRITRYSFALSCIDTLVVAMVFVRCPRAKRARASAIGS